MTIEQIADALREAYPTATAVTVFVSHGEVSVEVKNCQPIKGECSYRCLNGQWAVPTTERSDTK